MPESPLKQIRTFQGDVADALRSQEESLISIQQKELARQQTRPTPVPEEPRRSHSFLLVVGSFILVVLGVLGGWYSYKQYSARTVLPPVEAPANRFIRTKDVLTLTASSTRPEIVLALAETAPQSLGDGEVRQIQFTKKVAGETTLLTSADFWKILETRAPGSLVRSFDSLFMLGVVGGAKPSTFILVTLDSFESTFPGMLQWEPAMTNDLGVLLGTRVEAKNILPDATFEDAVIKNKDVRLIKDSTGEVVLLYTFLNQEVLLITDSPDTLRLLLSRLESESLTR